jgi:hypothetical protein
VAGCMYMILVCCNRIVDMLMAFSSPCPLVQDTQAQHVYMLRPCHV